MPVINKMETIDVLKMAELLKNLLYNIIVIIIIILVVTIRAFMSRVQQSSMPV